MERYFLISYNCESPTGMGFGNLISSGEGFFSGRQLREAISKQRGLQADRIVIMSIYEFKSKEDCDAYAYIPQQPAEPQ